MAEKITLVDTVKKDFHEELMSRIRSVVDPEKIDIVVSLHAEMDHSGCLPQVIKEVKPSKTYSSIVGKETLATHFYEPEIADIIALPDGSTLDLGNMQLEFLHTAMVHWPDSMMGILRCDGVLFSQDGFGLHIATSQRFDDELPLHDLERAAAAYYANILLPFAHIMTKATTKLKSLLPDVKMIVPSHGPMWRTNREWIMDKYLQWSAQKPTLKAVVLYDTMWGSVDKMARAIADGMAQGGVEVRLMRARENYRSDVIAELLTAGAFVVGSSTLNRGLLPTIADKLQYVKGLKPKKKIGAAFGSYGWGGGATKQLEQQLKDIGIKVVADAININYVPNGDALGQCRESGLRLAAALKQHCGVPDSRL
uniref:Flavodoxin-like domain-containing protein n=1 Tax=Eutreptiella gymnastica TaxID=73025 RepID=A0A7S4CJD7_9EUGL|eukprot:CAMPEP_0174366640 /NCGR_PEP_ID=MMETSP0811_2-20130205/81977_1 /TAXON_ID=73025 ORGANISM="Eutreptiella gymnastica-like, Strain CCMP1594" /NCGR_SAMPLE_ID=MMETSP0811_2 /ASSEMBLY_ACC=CAM_ASM_000667 /LENGTH=366 /DNA_ID=CAMNT_0015508389 /DNA_START=170 /DNA_END=1270 /DNA_ORIENTATION=-